jgi:hypothetical protein
MGLAASACSTCRAGRRLRSWGPVSSATHADTTCSKAETGTVCLSLSLGLASHHSCAGLDVTESRSEFAAARKRLHTRRQRGCWTAPAPSCRRTLFAVAALTVNCASHCGLLTSAARQPAAA